ncbi:MAG: DinB family protein [Gemmatimonas sp.]|uniref:DinB family protein n=1 Tax=Gemmatimonas sp. TaxID=1962908 RepID=UPI00391EE446|nr:hypothetical protein [Gemmatimonadota bacterium]
MHRHHNLAGVESANALWQMLLHVVNHATYHRGQVTTLLGLLGAAPPPSTDLMAFFRERGTPSPSTPRVVHVEIHATNPEASAAFYRALFGWHIARWGDMPYWTVTTGHGVPGIDGGIVPRRGEAPTDGHPVNATVVTVNVPSVDDTLAQATALGAPVALPKTPIPAVGWLACFKDLDGNLLGLMQDDPAAP